MEDDGGAAPLRAAIVEDYDRAPQAGDFDSEPSPADGAQVVKVSVAGLNPVDLYTAAGELPNKPPLPSIAGKEGIGTVDGRRVYFDAPVAPFGSMAERAQVDDESLIDVPDGVDDALAVTFGIAGLAAWLGMDWRGGLREGETVLVLGASGVVGQIAVQGARLLGASTVVAAARSDESLARAKDELGADAVVKLDGDGLADHFRKAAGGDIDLVVDPLWGEPAVTALEALADGGRLVQIGNSAGATTELPARTIRTGVKSVLGHTNVAAPQDVKREAFQRMCRHAAAGELTVPVEEVPLDAVEDAWERQSHGPHQKLVIRP
jgi:NADPH:quinone reductase-like Zn-dependent oxidoreductase